MKKKVSLVLSGGGARGLAHIGVIEELERRGYEIISISGTSMGALIGGMYATGKMEEYKRWIKKLDRYEVFKLIDFTLSNQGFIKGKKVFDKIKEFVPDVNIEDLEIDFTATATDLLNAKEVVFKSGKLFEAIRASISIPTVFTPVESHGTLLVDGGVINNIPIHLVKREADSVLVVVDVNADVPVIFNAVKKEESEEDKVSNSVYMEKINGIKNFFLNYTLDDKDDEEKKEEIMKLNYYDIMDRITDILSDRISEMVLEKNPPDVLISVSRKTCKTFDFYKADELIEIGRQTTKLEIEKYKELSLKKKNKKSLYKIVKGIFSKK